MTTLELYDNIADYMTESYDECNATLTFSKNGRVYHITMEPEITRMCTTSCPLFRAGTCTAKTPQTCNNSELYKFNILNDMYEPYQPRN